MSGFTQVSYLPVNFHYMLTEDDELNFRELDEGVENAGDQSSTLTNGFERAASIISLMNWRLWMNSQEAMTYPDDNGNYPSIATVDFRYVMAGVYFHRDNQRYYYGYLSGDGNNTAANRNLINVNEPGVADLSNTYGSSDVLDVFFTDSYYTITNAGASLTQSSRQGYVNGIRTGTIATEIGNDWYQYKSNAQSGLPAGLITHEMGHIFGLHHPWLNNDTRGGGSGNAFPSNCDDTYRPSSGRGPYEWDANHSFTVNGQTFTGASNNRMGYHNSANYFTPCQVNMIEDYIANFNPSLFITGNEAPSYALFYIPEEVCASNVELYASWRYSGSKTEDSWSLDTRTVTSDGTPISSFVSITSGSGAYNNMNLSDFFTFNDDAYYEIRLTVNNNGSLADQRSTIVYIKNAFEQSYSSGITLSTSNYVANEDIKSNGNVTIENLTTNTNALIVGNEIVVTPNSHITTNGELILTTESPIESCSSIFNIVPSANSSKKSFVVVNSSESAHCADADEEIGEHKHTLNESTIQVYPNPFESEFNIQFEHTIGGPVTISILDMGGVLLEKQTFNCEERSLLVNMSSSLPSGMYFMTVESEYETHSATLIKN